MSTTTGSGARPDYDQPLKDIAEYVVNTEITSTEAYETARYDLMDTLACGMLALQYPACTKLLGPVVEGADMPGGVKIPGTHFRLDPVTAAWNIGAMVRWLDFNDTWLAAEWNHPSDNLGAILALSDHLSRRAVAEGRAPMTVRDLLTAMIKAHEIQGILGLENSFNRVGLDHVMLVRIASACVSMGLLGGDVDDVTNVASHAFIDGSALRAYRHAPQAGPRKSWAAGDASSRGLRLALIVDRGEIGYPKALSAPTWGFRDVLFKGNELQFSRGYGSYVMENILFKLSFPAEFHAQTAAEAAMTLHPQVRDRIDEVEKVVIETQEAGVRIIDKTGPLNNPADRDHCIQYMTAVPLIFGRLTADDYEDHVAADPRIDALRDRMKVVENEQFSKDYLDPEKRSIGNAVQVFFTDGSTTDRVAVEYPIGHRRRRDEGIPVLKDKFGRALATRFAPKQAGRILDACGERERLEAMPVHEFVDLWAL
ncbi:bifunctional 2-methylcitrate dehydratase/aconitate hydratase [Arhodomonas sp. KWT2]|uniref:bifunctional 2-methylcitrate dehydratase/aconitate hydratase n=1 Tax=Arhodomonas sp. KWT2 TaxID=3344194 RepID=UPI0035C25FB7